MEKTLLIICSIALLTSLPNGAMGYDVCVDSAAGLQAALNSAHSSGGNDIIRVVQGTYYGNFLYFSGQGHSLTLLGGYTAGCSEREIKPQKPSSMLKVQARYSILMIQMVETSLLMALVCKMVIVPAMAAHFFTPVAPQSLVASSIVITRLMQIDIFLRKFSPCDRICQTLVLA